VDSIANLDRTLMKQ